MNKQDPENHQIIMDQNFADSQRELARLQKDDYRVRLLAIVILPLLAWAVLAGIVWLVDAGFRLVAR